MLVAQSCPTLGTPYNVAHQALLSMGFSRQEYWSGLPFPSPGDFPDPGIKPKSPALQADSLPSEPPGKPVYFHPVQKLTISCRSLRKSLQHISAFTLASFPPPSPPSSPPPNFFSTIAKPISSKISMTLFYSKPSGTSDFTENRS